MWGNKTMFHTCLENASSFNNFQIFGHKARLFLGHKAKHISVLHYDLSNRNFFLNFCLCEPQPPSVAFLNYFLQDCHAMPLSLITITYKGREGEDKGEEVREELYTTLISPFFCIASSVGNKKEQINGCSKLCFCVLYTLQKCHVTGIGSTRALLYFL